MASKNIVDRANQFIFDLFKEKLSNDYVYHNYQHTLETVEACKKISKGYELSDDDKEILMLAAWFHDVGYVYTYKDHEEKSKEVAKEFLQEEGYDKEKTEEVLKCIEATKRNNPPTELKTQILCDADLISIGEKTFFIKAELLRAEWENFKIRSCDELEWANTQMDFLQSSKFHTAHAQKLMGEQLTMNIQEQTKKLKKLEKKNKKKKKEKVKSKAQPKRGIETMFRSIYSSHINLSSIADSKANMLINIHALMISITLTAVGAKFSLLGSSFKKDQVIIYPMISLLLTSLISIIFAILSAKPKVTEKITSVEEIKNKEMSIVFFGNFSNITIKEFETQIWGLMKSEEELYGNMIRDIYYLGKVLTQKYNLLRISYLVFMIGLITTVFLTVGVIYYLKQTDGF